MTSWGQPRGSGFTLSVENVAMHRKGNAAVGVSEHAIFPFNHRGQCVVDPEANTSTFAGQKVRDHILWSWRHPEAGKPRHSTRDDRQALSNNKVNLMPLGGLCDIPVLKVLKC